MAKAPHDPNKRYTCAKYSKNELLDILDTCIPIYRSSNEISFHKILQNHCSFFPTNWAWYLEGEKCDPDIVDRFNILREIQQQKTISGAMDGTYNPAFSMFLLKSRYGWIEEQHRRKLAIDEKKLEQDAKITQHLIDQDITVGFE